MASSTWTVMTSWLWMLLILQVSLVKAGEYCTDGWSTEWCDYGCCDDGCCGTVSVGAIVGGIVSLIVVVAIVTCCICCCVASCPGYSYRTRGTVLSPGTVVTTTTVGGATNPAMQPYGSPVQQAGAYPQQPYPQQPYPQQPYPQAGPPPPPYPIPGGVAMPPSSTKY